MKTAVKFLGIQQSDDYLVVSTNAFDYRVYFVTEDIIRIRGGFDSQFEEASYALVTTAWDDAYDNLLKNERKRVKPLLPQITEEGNFVNITAGNLTLRIKKEPFAFGVKDQNGRLLYKDLEGRALREDHLGRRFHYFELEKNDNFYGLGESTGSLNKIGKEVAIAPKDSIGYDSENTTNLYKHIPFYIKISGNDQGASGYFYNNFWNSKFNFGAEVSGYWHPYGYFQTDGGDIDLFIINGPCVQKVVERYTDLTGKTYLAPLYSLGYLGSTMYYVELPKDCDGEILDFVEQNLAYDIPIDGFQLSSGYTVGADGKRYVLTWNHTRFHDPKAWFAAMNNLGVTVSPNVKPGILLTHPKYNDFLAHDAFIKTADATAPYTGLWWGGAGSFVDFTNPKAREFWKQELIKEVLEQGTSSVWNDNCEYEIEDAYAYCDNEGMGGYAGALRSFQSNMMCFTTHKAIHQVYPNLRPYVVCRSGAAGIQRYAQTWSGDNFTSWKSLKYNIATMLGMGLSGVANQGADVGGFQGKRPDAELLLRWVQHGIFMPRFSIHSCNTDNTVTEPWMYEDVGEMIKDAIHFRYQHMPYLYSLLYKASQDGQPIMRALICDFQGDADVYHEAVDFMFGASMLVSNIVNEGEIYHQTYLPKGQGWYDYTSRNYYQGGEIVEQEVDLDDVPIFIPEGAIIPTTNDLKRLQKDEMKAVNILFAPGKESQFCWYQDDGKTLDYQKGDYLKTNIHTGADTEKYVINFSHEGNYASPVESLSLEVINIHKGGYWVEIDGQRIPQIIDPKKYAAANLGWRYDATAKAVRLKYPYRQTDYQVVISFEPFDLIGMSDPDAHF
ncbi:MAG: TIM-barrel domain-containing protein [Alphaproteobacteria bacterium]